MKKLKSIDYKLLFELMTNSKRSDRQLAKILGVSQPTVTRKRAVLEKEVIDGYTAIPKWEKLGYTIFAFTFVKTKSGIATKEKYENVRKTALEWLKNQPNIIMASSCRGMGVDAVMISIHKTYAEYDKFMLNHRLELGDLCDEIHSVIVNLAGNEILKPLHLKYLAGAE